MAIHSSILAWEIHGGTLLIHINIYISILCTFITIKLFFKWNAMHCNNKGDFSLHDEIMDIFLSPML